MANQFKTSQKTELVALRAAEAAAYLTVGSRKYIKEDLKNKRNGVKYQFVISDNGEYARGIDISAGGVPDLKERTIEKSLKTANVKVKTNLIEPVTDLNWDKEVAIPNGKKLIMGAVEDVINGVKGKVIDNQLVTHYDGDLGMQDTAFVGVGFGPLSEAVNYLNAVSDEDQFLFIHPQINAKLDQAGAAFQPTKADPIFSKGLLGTYSGHEVRTARQMPLVSISATLAAEVPACSSVEYDDTIGSGVAKITFSGVTGKFPKGSVVWFRGAYACDLIGERTSELRAFVAVEDGTEAGVMITRAITEDEWIGRGTKSVAKADGSNFGATKAAAISAFNSFVSEAGKVKFMEAGDYFGAVARLDGAEEFETLDTIDASNADTERATNEGLNVFQNRGVDVLAGSNVTRWSTTYLAGIVEPRAVSYILVKDAAVNLVKVVNN